jgi:hypothetical protein
MMHEEGNILLRIFNNLETSSVFKSIADMYLEDCNGTLIPVKIKLRLIIDKEG